MALIKCPECGKEISDKAEACPNCGCPSSEFIKLDDVVLQEEIINFEEKDNHEEVPQNEKRHCAFNKIVFVGIVLLFFLVILAVVCNTSFKEKAFVDKIEKAIQVLGKTAIQNGEGFNANVSQETLDGLKESSLCGIDGGFSFSLYDNEIRKIETSGKATINHMTWKTSESCTESQYDSIKNELDKLYGECEQGDDYFKWYPINEKFIVRSKLEDTGVASIEWFLFADGNIDDLIETFEEYQNGNYSNKDGCTAIFDMMCIYLDNINNLNSSDVEKLSNICKGTLKYLVDHTNFAFDNIPDDASDIIYKNMHLFNNYTYIYETQGIEEIVSYTFSMSKDINDSVNLIFANLLYNKFSEEWNEGVLKYIEKIKLLDDKKNMSSSCDELVAGLKYFGDLPEFKNQVDGLSERVNEMPESTENDRYDEVEEPYIGMSAYDAEYHCAWGRPTDKNITETEYGKSEQWVYSGYKYLYIENDKVTSIQK